MPDQDQKKNVQDQKKNSSVAVTVSDGSGRGRDVAGRAPAKPLTSSQVLFSVVTLSVTILSLSIAALVCSWFIARLTFIPSTPGGVITSQGFELFSTIVKQWTAVTTTYTDYEVLVLLQTKMVIYACRGFTVVTLTASLIVLLLALASASDDVTSLFINSSIARGVYSRLPRWMSLFCVFFSVGAVLILLALMNSMPRDDIIRQVTAGAFNCRSGVFDCNSFWSDNLNSVSDGAYRDYHRPHTSFWLMVAASILSVKLWLTVLKNKDVVQMTNEFADSQRDDEMQQQPAANRRSHQV